MRDLDRDLLLELCGGMIDANLRIDENLLIANCVLQDESSVELTLDLPTDTFYTLPEFTIDLKQYSSMQDLPHVGPTGKICTFDSSISQPDPRKPEHCVATVLMRAIKVLNDGITGANFEDYSEEIDAYWCLKSEGLGYLCDTFPEETTLIYYALTRRGKKKSPCFASDAQSAIKIAKRLGDHGMYTPNAYQCLFLRLNQPLSFPLPSTCGEWDAEVGRSGKKMLKEYRGFLSKSNLKNAFIVLSVPTQEGQTRLCLRQPTTPRMRGFRLLPKLHAAALRMPSYRDKSVEKYLLQDISQSRLFDRGGTSSILDGQYAIIGCGSLGSHLARQFADFGVTDFIIIDQEILTVENIARHVCGFKDVGEKKARALKVLLEESNPNIECKAICSDANAVLENEPTEFGRCRAIFITAADVPLEYHFAQALHTGTIDCPVIVMWIEAFSMAAHALVLNKPQNIFTEMFDEDLSFLNPVIENSSEYLRREAGCQSTYMPYSGLDVQAFLLDFLHLWQDRLQQESNRNYHYVWVGKLSVADKYEMKVAKRYTDMPDYSHYLERID